MNRYGSRTIGAPRKAVYEVVQKLGGARKGQIVEATGLKPDAVRVIVQRACKDGELIHDGQRNGLYTMGVMKDRTVKKPKKPVTPEKCREYQERHKIKHGKKVRPSRSKEVLKQTKPYNPVKPVVNIVYPPNYKYTVIPCQPYQPLVS